MVSKTRLGSCFQGTHSGVGGTESNPIIIKINAKITTVLIQQVRVHSSVRMCDGAFALNWGEMGLIINSWTFLHLS